jgi:hypothetical protein
MDSSGGGQEDEHPNLKQNYLDYTTTTKRNVREVKIIIVHVHRIFSTGCSKVRWRSRCLGEIQAICALCAGLVRLESGKLTRRG